jgi:hypothetical protein
MEVKTSCRSVAASEDQSPKTLVLRVFKWCAFPWKDVGEMTRHLDT